MGIKTENSGHKLVEVDDKKPGNSTSNLSENDEDAVPETSPPETEESDAVPEPSPPETEESASTPPLDSVNPKAEEAELSEKADAIAEGVEEMDEYFDNKSGQDYALNQP